jgi:transcriptional regulator with XRE-family HTH domain
MSTLFCRKMGVFAPRTLGNVNLGERIANLRGKRSQNDIAQAAGTDLSTIRRIEGGSDMRLSKLTAIAGALGIPLHRLLDPAHDSVTYLSQPELVDHRIRLGALEERVNRLTEMVQNISEARADRSEGQAGTTTESPPQSDGK